MAEPALRILPWDRPLPTVAVEWLVEGWGGDRVLDLSDTLLIVPTRQAGRRLREALAARAGERKQAVFPPRVVQPEQVLDLAAPANARRPASRAAQLVGWIHVLREISMDDWREVFPIDPPDRSFRWALGLAEEFVRLQDALAEGALRMGDVATRAGAGFPERERWEQLGGLERLHDNWLGRANLVSPGALHQVTAREPAPPPPEVRRIVLLATPDPRPAVLAVIEKWLQKIEGVVLAFGDPREAGRFDSWGRPVPLDRVDPLASMPEFEQRVHLCADPEEQAELAARWAARYEAQPGMVALACADAEVVPRLASSLDARKLVPYLPQGEELRRHGLVGLIDALLRAVREDRWETIAALARHTPLIDWLGRTQRGFSAAHWLDRLDRLQAEHLPPTLREARRHAAEWPDIATALDSIAQVLEELRHGDFPDAWHAVLARMHAGRVLDTARPDDDAFVEVAEAWRATAAMVAEAGRNQLQPADAAELTLRLVAAGRRFGDKPPGAVEIDGWLEVLFRQEPHVIIAGCNDGRVPEAVTGHAFLPESLRERLGLGTNAQRLARDAWQLSAVIASRAGRGRVDLILGKTSASGDPLRPSRLFFQCDRVSLPARVAHLFRALPPSGALVPWKRAWRLRPPLERPRESMRVTAFRDYLDCPFRFYLKHVLRLQSADTEKRELDARDFGGLVHGVLEGLGRRPEWRDCTNDRDLAFAFTEELDRIVAERYGTELALPLIVQIESARQRLSHAARVQAEARAEGWVIQHVEWPFPDGRLSLAGLAVRGTIDRIERNEKTGRWRVLDYKTAETAKDPLEAHVRFLRAIDAAGLPVAEARIPGGTRERRWIDLQLPLYRWAVSEVLGVRDVELGYFNLPKALTETAITPWNAEDEDLQESALACATAIAEAVVTGKFWPPTEGVRHDDYATLFHEGVAASVEWTTPPDAVPAETEGAAR